MSEEPTEEGHESPQEVSGKPLWRTSHMQLQKGAKVHPGKMEDTDRRGCTDKLKFNLKAGKLEDGIAGCLPALFATFSPNDRAADCPQSLKKTQIAETLQARRDSFHSPE